MKFISKYSSSRTTEFLANDPKLRSILYRPINLMKRQVININNNSWFLEFFSSELPSKRKDMGDEMELFTYIWTCLRRTTPIQQPWRVLRWRRYTLVFLWPQVNKQVSHYPTKWSALQVLEGRYRPCIFRTYD